MTDTTSLPPDVEATVTASPTNDPFKLQDGRVDEPKLAELRARRRVGKRLERYHKEQNELIDMLLRPMETHTADAKESEENARIPVKIGVWASLIGNVILAAVQLYAAISSGSLALIATGIDAVFDVGSNAVLFWLHRKAKRLDVNKWPVGGARLENIGNIVYGSLMSAVNLIVIVQAVQELITSNRELKKFFLPSIIAVAVAFGVKLLLFLYCFSLREKSSQIHVLWEDHRNDLFINGFGILTSAGGSRLTWWLDPFGALLIALAVILLWATTIYKEFELLAGKSAPHEFLQLVTYKAATFSDDIYKIDTVRAYHSGPDYFVEIDVVMDPNTPLQKAHDVAQILQDKIEVLPNVERAFVHVDHETDHAPEHRKIM